MADPVQLKFNQADVLKVKTIMAGVGKSANPVMSRGINKTLGVTQTFAVKRIYNTLNLTQTRIKKDFTQNKASTYQVKGSLVSKGGPVGLASFTGTKELARGGVSYKVHRSKSRSVLKHAFMAKGKGQTTTMHVFERQHYGKKPYRKGFPYAALPDKYRFPLERKTGPRIEDEYGKTNVLNPTMEYADYQLGQQINSQLDYELSKLK